MAILRWSQGDPDRMATISRPVSRNRMLSSRTSTGGCVTGSRSNADGYLGRFFGLGRVISHRFLQQCRPIVWKSAHAQHVAEYTVGIVGAPCFAQRVLVVDPGIEDDGRL